MKWRSQRTVLSLLSLFLLFPGFCINFWQVVDLNRFRNYDRTSESLSLARMVISRQEGFFSHAGLPGQLRENTDDPRSMYLLGDFQYSAYLNDLPYLDYQVYRTRSGATELIYSIIDQTLPFPAPVKLNLLRAFGALLAAATFTVIIMWFHSQFGWPVYLAVLLSSTASLWLVVMARNLWWGLWIPYIPLVIMLLTLQRERESTEIRFGRIVLLSSFALFFKCLLQSYEFITTVLIMMTVPFIFYGILDRWGFRKIVLRLTAAAVGSLAGISASMAILARQISIATGESGLAHLVRTLGKRAHGEAGNHGEQFSQSLNSNLFEVILTYLQASWIDLNHLVYSGNRWVAANLHTVRFSYLIVLFLVATFYLLARRSSCREEDEKRLETALICATWYSLLAPLSWFIIFKAHAYIHTHIDPIVWHMPFTLFGFALCGLILKDLIHRRRKNHLNQPAP